MRLLAGVRIVHPIQLIRAICDIKSQCNDAYQRKPVQLPLKLQVRGRGRVSRSFSAGGEDAIKGVQYR